MKLAVLSDVHGNLPALEAVVEDLLQWQPDRVVVNGDLINRGPHSRACLELLMQQFPDIELVKGNHEEFVLGCAHKTYDNADPRFELSRFAHWTYAQLGELMDEVASWHDDLALQGIGNDTVQITHASRLGKRSGISLRTPEEELSAKLGARGALFITSHTHKAMLRKFDGTLIVNTGSVGSPSDLDPRSAYARCLFEAGRWQAQIVRLNYDRERAERDFFSSGFIEEGGALTRLMVEELRHARVFVGPWNERYLQAVLAGTISVEAAVAEFVAREFG